ncbi:MAG: carbon-nitrogen hydrolase family protein, partial [Christensenellales bacterium]
ITPFGKVAVGICFDSRRRHFYENVKDEKLSLILFPHGSSADPKKSEKERQENDTRCMMYVDAFGVPVVYVNSKGSLEDMPGKMGAMMKKRGFRLNGMSKIYAPDAVPISVGIPEAIASEIKLCPKRRVKDIRFYGNDILPGNRLFKHLILRPDPEAGIRLYEANR